MLPNPLPVLENESVRLRPLVAADREALFAIADDPLLWAQHSAKDRWQRPVFDALFDDAVGCRGAFTLEDRHNDNNIIGSTRLKYLGHNALEIGWTFLSRQLWGTGYNRAMKELLIAYVFRLGMDVAFYVYEQNIRSQRAVGKLGAQRLLQTDHPLFSPRPEMRTYLLKREP